MTRALPVLLESNDSNEFVETLLWGGGYRAICALYPDEVTKEDDVNDIAVNNITADDNDK